jgi:uncharacterized membrane protein
MADETEGTEEEGGQEDAASKVQDAAGNGIVSRLKSKEVLIPVAATAATALAGLAARKGPEMAQKVKGLGGEAAEDLGERGARGAKQEITGGGGGIGGIAGGVMSKAMGGGHDKPKTRRLQIQRWTDVAVPLERAYEAWTNFEEYPKFMHRVLSVKQDEDSKVTWEEKIWFSKRQWEAEIIEQQDNEFLAWKTTSGASHAGVVSFHKLEDRLTRVMVTMDFRPTGMFEKMASGLRFVKRAVQADLARFKSYVEFQEAGLDAPQERLEQVKEDEKAEDKDDDKGEVKSQSDGDQSDQDNGESEAEREERKNRREQREKATA